MGLFIRIGEDRVDPTQLQAYWPTDDDEKCISYQVKGQQDQFEVEFSSEEARNNQLEFLDRTFLKS